VPWDQTVFNLGWAHMKAHHILNLTPPILASSSGPANAFGLPQAAQQLRSELTLGHHIQGVINRFVGHPLRV
jgi:hypothetical protein